MDSKKIKVLTIVGVLVLLVTVIGLTYAFFAPQAGGTTSTNATVTSNTTDLLTFSINRDISFTVNQANFEENGENQSGDATATATLTPNNKTGAATMNYYLYLNIEENPFDYSSTNTNELPELMLQVFDGNNQLVTLTGLGNQQTVKGVTGYDITTMEGAIVLLDNHAISASNNTATIENWRVVITLINHNFNQNDNTGKSIVGNLIISEENPVSYVYWNDGYRNIYYYDLEMPVASYLKTNRTELLYFSQEPHYIKTTMFDNNPIKHEVCLWYNNHEFCFEFGYWDTDAATTKIKLKADMENALGITISDSDCTIYSDNVSCKVTQYLECHSNMYDGINCSGKDYECAINRASAGRPNNTTVNYCFET